MNTLTKLNKTEQRALEACRDIRANACTGSPSAVVITWRKDRTWGRCPSVRYNGERIASATGCGYDKRSAALASALRWLGETPEQQRDIGGTACAGVGTLADALAKQGWHLERTYDGKNEEAYTLTHAPA